MRQSVHLIGYSHVYVSRSTVQRMLSRPNTERGKVKVEVHMH